MYMYTYTHCINYIYNHGPFTTSDGIVPAKRLAKLGDLWC